MSQEEIITMAGEYTEAVGRRKKSIARVRIYPGTGKFIVNGKKLNVYLPTLKLQQLASSPLSEIGSKDTIDISAKVVGGGIIGQAEAIRLGLSRGFVKRDENLRGTLKKLGFLRRDARKKERKKPGLKSARRAPQWAKR